MGQLEQIREWLASTLQEVAAEHRVPGAAVAVGVGDEIVDAAYGVLSRTTGVEATTDSLFQIGSITKVWTASMIMQLVDEGRLDLDAPVRRYLPEFRVADESASAAITTRQLCCHVAGFEGDIFTDTGRGDDAVKLFVAGLTAVSQLFPAGERFSYNNAGYVVLGRLVEVLRGQAYNTALREHLIGPLGLRHAATDAHEAILHRAAVGHIAPEPDAEEVAAPVWALVASNAPAGSQLATSAADLVRFAQAHLDPDGKVLPPAVAEGMRQRQAEVPDLGILGDAWGIGWEIFDWTGGPVVGHDGSTIGQTAFLRVVPAAGVAVALLTNGGDALPVFHHVIGRALRELAGVVVPELPTPPPGHEPVDPRRYAGRYEADVAVYEVTGDGDGRLWLSITPRGVLVEAGALPERYELARLDGDRFVSTEKRGGIHVPVVFQESDADGRARFLHQGRAVPRAS